MDLKDFGVINSKVAETFPLSIHEVSDFFENRKDLTSDFEYFKFKINEDRLLVQSKIYEYTKRFRQFDKTQVKKMRELMENLVSIEIETTSGKFQAKIILCKIMDLFPSTVSL